MTELQLRFSVDIQQKYVKKADSGKEFAGLHDLVTDLAI